MSEDNKDNLNQSEVETERSFSDSEKKAMEHGWNPNGVPGKRHKSAEEFLDNESFLDRISSQGRKLKSQEKMIENIVRYLQQSEGQQLEQAKQALDHQAQQAIEAGQDPKEVLNIYKKNLEQIESTKLQAPDNTSFVDYSKLSQVAGDFVHKYEDLLRDNIAIRGAVKEMENHLALQGLSEDERFPQLEQWMLKEYGEVLSPPKSKVSKVERTAEVSSDDDREVKSFSREELEVINFFKSKGVDEKKLTSLISKGK